LKKCFKILVLVAIALWIPMFMIGPVLFHLPSVWLGKESFPRSGEPFLEAHERAINTFVASQGFGIGRVRSAELWNEQSVKFEGMEYEGNHIRLIGLTAEEGDRYFMESDAPKKTRIGEAKWRPLSDWETEAVEKLKSGASFVSQPVSDPETDVRVIAPMCAKESCLECHDVKAGELIGALDYWLRIWPPLKRQKMKSKN